jgi:hypothetical protein
LAKNTELGSGLLVPVPGPLIKPAEYKGKPLTLPVDGHYTGDPVNIQLSSLQVLPDAPDTGTPHYGIKDAAQESQRPAPEYINIRHQVLENGQIRNLNKERDLRKIIVKGGYHTLHYIDGAGDGWVAARCRELDGLVDAHVAAYCMVALPDFFPKVKQRDLMLWWNNEVPKAVRDGLFATTWRSRPPSRTVARISMRRPTSPCARPHTCTQGWPRRALRCAECPR